MHGMADKQAKKDSPNTSTLLLSMDGNRDDDDNDDNNDVVMWEKTIAQKRRKQHFVNYPSIFKSLDLIDDNIQIVYIRTQKRLILIV